MNHDEIQDKFLEEVLKRAETLTKPPFIDHSLPNQILPRSLRLALRSIYLPVLLLDLFMQKLAKKIIRPPFKTEGKCKKRGNCCYYILLPEAKGMISKIYFFGKRKLMVFL